MLTTLPLSRTVEDEKGEQSVDEPKASPASLAMNKTVVGASISTAFLPPPSHILKN